MTRALDATQQLGQSIWFDDLHRELLQSGRLARMVEAGVGGVTSNPSIFEKAITTGDRYDAAIGRLVERGIGTAARIYEELALADVTAAADVLRPVYDRSRARDGYVSLEVPPALAFDADGTIQEALRLAAKVGRPNLMIKVPATSAGLVAVAELTARAINVNATLLFSVDVYRRVADAYRAGLERRAAQGMALDNVASVASFFVSRIDTAADKRLRALRASRLVSASSLQELQGRTAIACARLAYRTHLELVNASTWRDLSARGARTQRLLWASTSTKDPAYPKTLYVENLIGPDTVNTLPDETYRAFCDQGRPRAGLLENLPEAGMHIARLEALGISMHEIADELLDAGVQQFEQAFDRLLAAIELRRRRFAVAAHAT